MKKFLITIIVLLILMQVVGYFTNPEYEEKQRKARVKGQGTELTQ